MREVERAGRPVESGADLDSLFEGLREECARPPAAPGFLAGFRARRDTESASAGSGREGLERNDQAAPWRLLALRLAPAGALAAIVAMAMTLGMGNSSTAPEAAVEAPDLVEYPDPFAAGMEEAGVASVGMSDDEAGYELVAVLYDPLGTR
ncbi:MAG: hypothetical protein J4F98_02955 [Acidobacteria bacterium]|nr:hypothetical protein [Acidobacteriota bacterium]